MALALSVLFTPWVFAEDDAVEEKKHSPVVKTEIGKRVFEDLKAYYTSRDARKFVWEILPLKKIMGQLAHPDPVKRKEAGDYLHALCLQTKADDRPRECG
ncbi:MAG: hypothetical protein ACYTHM_24610, partial [Planctomycetota bacterium]